MRKRCFYKHKLLKWYFAILLIKSSFDTAYAVPAYCFSPDIIAIHGINDHTLPLRNINPSIIVKGGSHMMTLTSGAEINKMIVENLSH